jgi:hypothetical protein
MIEVEGYKAYSGKMRVTPKANFHGPFILTGQFLYKPDTDCWYHNGDSYPSSFVSLTQSAHTVGCSATVYFPAVSAFPCFHPS